ncbi:hypothetical protein M409DRAFT_59629 [Zasmidium cellare ATCC 36951]|uniref:t-SNARE coiled-coil homology domain-containing protein n=1 Tax=Zasmidium cellare ATCC 36951 TaxID=1080233 RepID=A0A6A6C4Q0_ZASCE|nr:uncharacterized protein M409DRAFT_59629 [Zasmidium cellare ATCC 36951]KAF2160842.1 hypothetical protein M409DRAFT_59629 [Zasmidium cellare ATCC 36951]
MASRFNQRDSRNALFASYDSQARSRPSSAASSSPAPPRSSSRNPPYGASPYGVASNDSYAPAGAAFSAYPGANGDVNGRRSNDGGFRSATPNNRGQYSDAVLSELESQNDDQASEMSKKVKMLKDLTISIGDEIRDSSGMIDKMNESFEGTRNRLRGTMNHMLRMAERSGIPWKVWLGFFLFVFLLFAYVWLF